MSVTYYVNVLWGLQFQMSQRIKLVDPRNVTHVVAVAEVNVEHGGANLFHLQQIEPGWYQVNVLEVMDLDFSLMHPHKSAD